VVHDLRNSPFLIEEDIMYSDNVEFRVFKTDGEKPYITIAYKAHGENRLEARERAKGLEYIVEIQDSMLLYDGFFEIPVDQKYRLQSIQTNLYLPVGYEVYLDESMIEIIYDIKNVHNILDPEMVELFWLMTDNGLVCVECGESIVNNAREDHWDDLEDNLESAAADLERKVEALEKSTEAFERTFEEEWEQ